MADIRPVTDRFAVAPQLNVEELQLAAQLGFSFVINNRPDGEVPDQPTSAQMQAAATAAGLGYVHVPVVGMATPDQVAQMADAIAANDGKALAFCRSGTRSIMTWARGQALAGQDREHLIDCALEAGYDISAVI